MAQDCKEMMGAMAEYDGGPLGALDVREAFDQSYSMVA